MNNADVVSLRGIRKEYNPGARSVAVLDNVDLDVGSGKFVGLVGPSGSGKSTLLHVIAGLVKADAGAVEVCGRNLMSATTEQILEMRRKELGYVFQDFRLLLRLTALENVMIPLLAARVPTRTARESASGLLASLGLGDRLLHFPRQLSGGEQQRVALARALVARPRVLLADEPTGNLDQRNALDVIKLLAGLPQQFGTTVIMVTHNLAFLEYTDVGYRLDDGRLEAI